MQVKSIVECSKGSIGQYFRPSLNYHLSLRPLFCLFSEWPFLHRFYCNNLIVSLVFGCIIAEKSSCNGPVEIDMDPLSQYTVSEIDDSSFNDMYEICGY